MELSFENFDSVINDLKTKGLDLHLRTETILKKKLETFFQKSMISSMDDFYKNLNNSDFLNKLSYSIIIDKTEIFRFSDAWNYLRSYIEIQGSAHHFKIYIPQCASGEDIISFAIIFDRLGFKNWHIHADAENDEKLQRASELYFEDFKYDVCFQNFSSMFDKNLFASYFTLKNKNYYFNHDIREHLTLTNDILERKSSNSTHDIVYAANILNQYKAEGQRNLLSNLYLATNMNGYLVLGNQEIFPLGFYSSMYKKADAKLPVYQKVK